MFRVLGFLIFFCTAGVSSAFAAPKWSWTLGLNAFAYGDGAMVEPGFGVPDQTLALDLRPSWKFYYGEWFKFTAIPRFIAQATQTGGAQAQETDLSLNELTAAVDVTDSFSLHGGKESYQWGPAEMLSPSNPIFHYTAASRSIVFLQKGKWLARANLSIGRKISIVALAEPVNNDDPLWSLDRPTEKKGLLKLEYQFDNGATYLGLTGGRAEGGRGFVGEYANFVLTDVVSTYFDVRHVQGNDAFYPVRLPSGVVDLQIAPEGESQILTLAIMGVRAEGVVDARFEYVFNQAGYTRDEFEQALQSPYLTRLISPGLEVFGIHSLYASIRKSDLGAGRNLSVSARYVHSLMDSSGAIFGAVERPFGDHFVGFLEGTYTHGGPYSEAGILLDYSVRLGAKLTL